VVLGKVVIIWIYVLGMWLGTTPRRVNYMCPSGLARNHKMLNARVMFKMDSGG
jgi:hypothetical protein